MKKYYEESNFIGVLEPHAYYIPFLNADDVFLPRRKSASYIDLNGTWGITEYKSILEVEDDFYLNQTKGEIPVPSCVQIHGYDNMQYTNTNFPFPVRPPYVPNENPCYHYSRKFSYDGDQKAYMCFEGVDSAFYLYVNDKFVGYSYISHRLSEFDVTPFLVNGENKVDVLVLKWCKGSYFEDQDKLRFTGIFRDVYILKRPKGHIVNYRIDTDICGKVGFALTDGESATVTFNGEEKQVKSGEKIEFVVNNPKLWSAENPYLYKMIISSKGEYIGEEVGIRSSEVKNGVYYFNGKPIKIKGVNRHDFNYKTGATVTVENIIEDFTLMKKLNVNAIRTSHYQNMPEFYKLCDKFGFYVMSESDMESHGSVAYKMDCEYWRDFSDLAKLPMFKKEILDRQKVNVMLNVNRPSINFWSLGNESGYSEYIAKAALWIKEYDSSRPIHYEQANKCVEAEDGWKRTDRYYETPIDVSSGMYNSIHWMHNEFLTDEREFRPFILCEYCHSMGNGPGDLKDYWDEINSNERYIGGYIWEWADHGVLLDGAKGLTYGGDYGENLHDGNFCMDGIITADRKITEKSLVMKKQYEPLAFELINGVLTVKSRWYFENVQGLLTVTKKENGKVLEETTFNLDLLPQSEITFNVGSAQVIIASVALLKDWSLLKKGEEIAREGWTKENTLESKVCKDNNLKITESGRYITANTKGAQFIIDKCSGEICSVSKDGKQVIDSPLEFNIWRAPTDNDMYVKNDWERLRYRYAFSNAYETVIKDNVVTVKGMIAPARYKSVVEYTLVYTFFDGAVKMDIDFTVDEKATYLPRLGFKTKLDKAFNKVKYFGYGPYANYVDHRSNCVKDLYENTVNKMEVNYVKPQENGSRSGCEFMEITDGKMVIGVEGDFSFSTLPHTIKEYSDYKHDWELPESSCTELCLDYFMSGLGSNSCGPSLDEKYQTPKKGKGSITIYFK